MEPVYSLSPAAFRWFEQISLIIFSIEYVLRLWSCTADPRYPRPILGRLRFFTTPLALIDLLVILPLYLPRYLEVGVPRSRDRGRIVPAKPVEESTAANREPSPASCAHLLGWAALLARLFAADLSTCAACDGRLRIISP